MPVFVLGHNYHMPAPDHYTLLGIPHDATQAQIKSAWRRAARAHHPDTNAGAGSAKQLTAVQEAYETLSDPARRRSYDDSLAGADTLFGGMGGGLPFGGLDDIFATVFGSSAATRRYSLAISLREAARGGPRRFTLPDGTILDLDLPPGVTDGTWLQASGVQVEVRVQQDPNFHVVGRDLHTTLELPLRIALNGGEVPVATLSGQVQLKIAPGTQNGTRLRLRGQGLSDPRGGAAGDLYVQASIRLPAMSAALKRWAKRMPAG